MNKIFFVVVIALVPFEVLDDNGKLQTMANIVKNMDQTRLCGYDCKPMVTIDGSNLTVSFNTTFADGIDTNALCQCMKDYMKSGVGDATSECKVQGNNFFAIVFRGEFNTDAKPVAPLTSLSNVLLNYDEPDIGGFKCRPDIVEKEGRIYIEITYKGKQYKSACVGILNYLNQNNLLDGASNKCTESDIFERAVLFLWSGE